MRAGVFAQKIAGLMSVMGLGLMLSGCLETLPQPAAEAKQQSQAAIAPRPGVSPSGASIAFVSLAGAPDDVRKALGDAMTGQVAQHKLVLASSDSANYLVRGNISAFVGGRNTHIAFVWDIYGADKSFRHRLEDSIVLPATAQDSWSLVSAQVIAEIAARSGRELSAYLTHTPEAIAAAKTGGAIAGVAGRAGTTASGRVAVGQPALGFAPIR